jgi:hypothetical protein
MASLDPPFPWFGGFWSFGFISLIVTATKIMTNKINKK